MKLRNDLFVLTFAAFMYCSSIFAGNNTAQLATAWSTDSFITFEPNIEVADYTLRITTPTGEQFQMHFDGTEVPYFQVQDFDFLDDGLYQFELVGSPILSNEAKAWMLEQREAGMKVSHETLREQGFIGETPMVLSGNFRIQQGQVFESQNTLEEATELVAAKSDLKDETPAGGSVVTDQDEGDRAQVYATDLIVQGSECVGMDCTTSESFGSDTIRLKENNLRIKFDDTSASGSFPSNDWMLVANDTNNGGDSYFAIQDVTGNKTPFKISAGVSNNALVVDAEGDVVIGSSSGNMELNIQDGDSPGLRIYQDTSNGYSQQIWDVAGNETNFFVRDITAGSKIPFKILPGADHNQLVISGSNRVGVGTNTPSTRFHIKADDAEQTIENSDTTSVSDRNLLTLKSNGGSRVEFVNTNLSDKTWQIANPNNRDYLQFTLLDSGAVEMTLSESGDLDVYNNITAGGTITSTSDRNAKENFKPISHQDILNKVSSMEILEWNYIKDQDETRHIGPMAQDFHAAFGVGLDNKHISMVDMDGVALASIKALNEKVDAKEATIQELKAQNDALAEKLSRIEALLQRLEK